MTLKRPTLVDHFRSGDCRKTVSEGAIRKAEHLGLPDAEIIPYRQQKKKDQDSGKEGLEYSE